jgi:hypothetical protein
MMTVSRYLLPTMQEEGGPAGERTDEWNCFSILCSHDDTAMMHLWPVLSSRSLRPEVTKMLVALSVKRRRLPGQVEVGPFGAGGETVGISRRPFSLFFFPAARRDRWLG